MLTVKSEVGPTKSRRFVGSDAALQACRALIDASASFYVEPYPDDEWQVVAADEHAVLLGLAHG